MGYCHKKRGWGADVAWYLSNTGFCLWPRVALAGPLHWQLQFQAQDGSSRRTRVFLSRESTKAGRPASAARLPSTVAEHRLRPLGNWEGQAHVQESQVRTWRWPRGLWMRWGCKWRDMWKAPETEWSQLLPLARIGFLHHLRGMSKKLHWPESGWGWGWGCQASL